MINGSIQETIQNHMKTLPDYVQDAIRSSDWERKILTIGRKYGLHVDQLEVLQTELSLAVLGLSDRDEFVRETMREARINKQTMDLMVADINTQIFEPIRNELRRVQEEMEKQSYREEFESVGEEEGEGDIEESNPSISGLEQHEEDLLKTHGVSFEDGEEESLQNNLPATKEKEEYTKRLSKPLKLSDATPKLKPKVSSGEGSSLSGFMNSISVDVQNESVDADKDVNQDVVDNKTEQVQENKQQPSLIPGEEIDIAKLAGAKTSEHQTIIGQSGDSGYSKQDPYREPIE